MTTKDELDLQIDRLHFTALRVKAERDRFLGALAEVRELIEGYVDVVDGPEGQPRPNRAMTALRVIDEATKGILP